jgi:hypothetical protein
VVIELSDVAPSSCQRTDISGLVVDGELIGFAIVLIGAEWVGFLPWSGVGVGCQKSRREW